MKPKITLWDETEALERLRQIETEVNQLALEARQILKAIAPDAHDRLMSRMAATILVH